MPSAISARGVRVTLAGRSVLDRVDFAAQPGQVTAILGPNGAGKSTLLKAVAGLLAFDGEIRVDGLDLAPLPPLERARLLAYVPQHTQLRAPLAVRDVVGLGRYARGAREERSQPEHSAAIEAAMRITDVLTLAQRPFTQLSGGEQRRVLIARAVATGARVLLLDEPTASLDVQHALGVFALCHQLAAEGRAVVLVVHQLADALRFADHVVLLDRGKVAAAGAASDVIAHARVRDVYGVHMVPSSAPSFHEI